MQRGFVYSHWSWRESPHAGRTEGLVFRSADAAGGPHEARTRLLPSCVDVWTRRGAPLPVADARRRNCGSPPPPPLFLFVSSPKLCWGDRDPPPSCYLRMSLTNSSVFLLNEVGYYQFSPPFFFSPPPPPPPSSLLFWGWSRSNWMRFILAVLLHVSCILSSANKRRRWTQVLVGGRRWCN